MPDQSIRLYIGTSRNVSRDPMLAAPASLGLSLPSVTMSPTFDQIAADPRAEYARNLRS